MSQPLIVLGDKTSHGGTVIACSAFSNTHGKGWARVGDMVSCPRCGGVFPIIQGDPSLIDDGRAVAYHGCKVACGATLIAGQQFTVTTPSGGSARLPTSEQPEHVVPDGFGAIHTTMAAGYQNESLDQAKQRFRGRFQVLDLASGEPIVGQAIRVRSTGGQDLVDSTDAEGFTPWVEHDVSEPWPLI
jgi:uncharacterized Zn-binding protein involved in type VI secretion